MMASRFCNICPNYWECGGRRWDTACQLNPENWPEEDPENWPEEDPENWPEEDPAPSWPKINPYFDDKTESGIIEED